MDDFSIEEKEIVEINNKKYTVITELSNNRLSLESLKKLLINYVIEEVYKDK